jgi:exopolyphosphatase/guanosine-5'-triphosphate,3'-diphosphate pyrophosphatase
MDHVVSRWEWRTFGHEFGPAEAQFAALGVEKVQNSHEIYLLADSSDANVKIRDQLLDIKVLEDVSAQRLEQWRPVVKEPFPLGPSALGPLCEALRLPSRFFAAGDLSLDQLLADLGGPAATVHIVRVTKTRARYHVRGCVAELTDIGADGLKTRTVAIEDEYPAKVIAAVQAVGLDGYENINYSRGLKSLFGMSR